jgi:hypothetical protein
MAVLAATAAWAAGDQDFVLVNKTGLTVDELYISPADDSRWGEDVLGKDVLGDDEEVTIEFSHKETECIWDLKVVDEDGDEVVWEAIDLCKARRITLRYEGKRPTATIQ